MTMAQMDAVHFCRY